MIRRTLAAGAAPARADDAGGFFLPIWPLHHNLHFGGRRPVGAARGIRRLRKTDRIAGPAAGKELDG